MSYQKSMVVRRCDKCGKTGSQNTEFDFMGDGVWRCHNCSGKYTHIHDIIETKKELSK